MMKRILWVVLLILCTNAVSQESDSLLTHYPLQVGNMWDFGGGITEIGIFYPSLMLKSSIGDTVYSDATTYKIIEVTSYNMNGQQKPGALGSISKSTILQRVDSTSLNVYQISNPFQNQSYLIDSLLANIGDEFEMFPGQAENILSLIDTATTETFGEKRKERHLMIINPLVGFEFKTTQGLGEFFWASGGEGSPSFRELTGAVIKGDILGTLQRVLPSALETSLTELSFSQDIQSQTLHLRNPNEGLTIIDSVDVNDEQRFYSQPGYDRGYYAHTFFSKGPFLVFPNDSIRLEIFVRNDTLNTIFDDTLRVFARGINGTVLPSISIPIQADFTVSVEDNSLLPKNFLLSQNYPNPFNPRTTIRFELPRSSFVTLKVFNLLGQEMETLVNESRTSGIYKVIWTPKAPSGIYLYRIEAGDFVDTKKLILVK